MASVIVTPRVARIHFDSNQQQWHLSISELKKDAAGEYTAPELKQVFDSLTGLLNVLLQFWLLASPTELNDINAPMGDLHTFGAWLQGTFTEGPIVPTPDPGVG